MVGKAISHYEILEKLGEGGRGVVWKARDKQRDRSVAIRVPSSKRVADVARKARFVQEAQTSSPLNRTDKEMVMNS